MQIQVTLFFVYEKSGLDACVSCPFRVEAEHIAVFHQMSNEGEKFYAVLDFGESGTIHVLQVTHDQLARQYGS